MDCIRIMLTLQWLCLFLSMIPVTSSASSLFVVSDHKSLGTAVVRDETADTLLLIGVTTTISDTPSCLVMVLDSKDEPQARMTLQTPPICTGGVVVNHGVNGLAMIAGMDRSGTQAALLRPLANINGATQPLPGTPFALPEHTIPVAMTNAYGDESSSVFVALQDTDGTSYDGSSSIRDLKNYLNRLSQPATASAAPPQLVKMDAVSGTGSLKISLHMDHGKATISGLLLTSNKKTLLVAGSTNGMGPAVGTQLSGRTDWDGYIGFFNALTGDVESEAIRIDTGKNDYVHAICLSGDGYVYIVGTTEGQIKGGMGQVQVNGGAFVFLMEVATGNVKWSRQLSGTTVEGLGCVVSHEPWCIEGLGCAASQHVVFIGGTTNEIMVEPDNIDPDTSSKTTTSDVFVSALSPFDGKPMWTKQLDSTLYFGNDREDDFVSMHVTSDGNVGVCFNSMTEEGTDIVLLRMDKHTGESDFDSLGEQPVDPSNTQTNNDDDNDNKAIIIPAVVLPIVFLLLVVGWHFSQPRVEHIEPPHANDHDLSFPPSEPSDAKVFV